MIRKLGLSLVLMVAVRVGLFAQTPPVSPGTPILLNNYGLGAYTDTGNSIARSIIGLDTSNTVRIDYSGVGARFGGAVTLDGALSIGGSTSVTGLTAFSGGTTIGAAINGYAVAATGNIRILATEPRLVFSAAGEAANGKIWDWDLTAATLALRTRNDAESSGLSAISILRSGTSLTSTTFNIGDGAGVGGTFVFSNGGEGATLSFTTADTVSLTSAAATSGFIIRNAANGSLFLGTNDLNRLVLIADGSGFNPITDNVTSLGTGSKRYVNGYIQSVIAATVSSASGAIIQTGTPVAGGNGTLVASSTDTAGKVLSTTTGAATITVTFAAAFAHAPACTTSNETTANLARASSSTTVLTISGVTVTGDSLSYSCLGF